MKQMKRFACAALLAALLLMASCAIPQQASSSGEAASSASSASAEEATNQASSTEVTSSGDASSSASTSEVAGSASASTTSDSPAAENALSLWTDDSPTAALVKDYVADVTNEASPNYIPLEDRIVTIDWDGTLYGELDPIYLDWAMYIHRTLWDSTYTPTDEQVEVAHAIETVEQTREFPEDLEARHAKALAEVFAGMSEDDVYAYVAEFAETDAPKFTGMKRKDAYFLPMVELVNYLHDNGFECFVVSGTNRNVLRVLLPAYFPWLDNAHIKGTVSTVEASGQGDTDGLEYVWTSDDQLTLGDELVIKNVKANKPTIIATEIGKQPVISLGNSSGDASMANYTVNNNKYRSIALMLCCDDTERDWGEVEKAEKMRKSCEENGWHAVSQRDEWKTIYGEGVERDLNWTWSSEVAGPNQKSAQDAAASSQEAAESAPEEGEEELPMAA